MQNNLKDIITNKISYTKQSYESIFLDIINMFKPSDNSEAINSNWNNISETDIMTIFLSLLSAHKDMLNYMIDYRTLESFMATAKERASIVRQANSYGYKIPSYKAGSSFFEVSQQGESNKAYIEFGTQFNDVNNAPWVYFGDSKLYYNGETIELHQGILHTLNINIDNAKNSNKTHILSSPNITIGSAYKNKSLSKLIFKRHGSVDVDEEFIEVENLYRYTGTNFKVYELNVDPQGLTYIKFHKDLDLSVYSSADTFIFYYVTTNGATVESANNIIGKSLLDEEEGEESYIFNFTPTGAFYKGSDPLAAAEIKEDFKYYYASSDLLITLKEYKNFILNKQSLVQDITKCLIIDNQQDTEGYDNRGSALPLGQINIYAAKATGALTQDEVDALTAEINNKKAAGTIVYVNSDLAQVSVYVELNIANPSDEIKDFVKAYVNSVNIGTNITIGAINQVINESTFRDEYNSKNGTITVGLSSSPVGTNVQLNYNQYANCIIE